MQAIKGPVIDRFYGIVSKVQDFKFVAELFCQPSICRLTKNDEVGSVNILQLYLILM